MSKIERNDPCFCGSGKKYKKCHYLLEEPSYQTAPPLPQPFYDPHYFQTKGKTAEQFVHSLAEKSFFTDWCFPNPRRPDGKELCDLLVVFGEIAIIWQIKDIKTEDGQFKPSDIDKNVNQLLGARRQLFEIKAPVQLENARRKPEPFDSSKIKEVFLISALLGDEVVTLPLVEITKNHTIHVFTSDFLQIVLKELDTITDFVNYLREKQNLINRSLSMILEGGEQELLANYLKHGRKFSSFDGYDVLDIGEGLWARHLASQEYQFKKKEDEISYYWDDIVNRIHEDSGSEYERIGRELARMHRFDRRVLSRNMYECHLKSHQTNCDRHRVIPLDEYGITCCFMFKEDNTLDREFRKFSIVALCKIARVKYPQNKKVIGIATERLITPTCRYEYVLIDMEEMETEFQKEVEELQEVTKFLTKAELREFKASEYYPANKEKS